VVAYGLSSKKLLTGSMGSVDVKEIQETATYSLEGALIGRTSGVHIIQNSGTPGSSMGVKIRGTSSIFAGTQPLYIMDGIPMTIGNYSQIGYGGQGIDASMDINLNNIESITILKDASSSAIYGTRAANGVILITTKKGNSKRPTIGYRSYLGYQKEWKRLDLMNADEWKKYVSTFNPDFLATIDPVISTDWQEEVFTGAPMTNHELSYSGGNEKTLIYLSSGFLKQKGIIIGTGYEKYSFRANLDHHVSDNFRISLHSALHYSVNDRVRGDVEIDGVLPNAISMPPIYPVYDDLGNYAQNGYFSNPVATANESTNEARTLRNISSLEFSYRINDKFIIKNLWGLDLYNLHERRIEPASTRIGLENNGLIIEGTSDVSKLTQQLTFDYSNTLGEVHHLQFLMGYSFEMVRKRYNYIYATNFPSIYPKYISSAGNIESASTNAVDEGINSFFGRLKYNFDDKYLFEISLRSDGSSKFGTNNRYAFLPAASAAWRIIEEAFMENQSLFTDLKLRLGYGFTGNDQIGNDRYQNLYLTGFNYYSQPGIVPKQIPNPDLKWETTANFNVGIDVEMLEGRIGFSAEYYYNLTEDLLLPRPLPGSSGFTTFMTNVGSIENKGFELTLNTININKAFRWTTAFNIAFNKNKVIELFNAQPIYLNTRGNNAIIQDYPLGVFYMYESQGVDPATGDLILTDLDKNGIIDESDKMVVGDPNALFTGGITNIFSFKGFDLSLLLQGVTGMIYMPSGFSQRLGQGGDKAVFSWIKDRWTPQNRDANYPVLHSFSQLTETSSNYIPSTFWAYDDTYVRIKNIQIGYVIPKRLTKALSISNLRLSVTAQNLLTWTLDDRMKNYDPEAWSGGGGLESYYPIMKLVNFGIDVTF